MKVAIIGTGYVGLPTGAGLASLGHQVTCVDCIPEKIEKLRVGQVTLFEEGLGDFENGADDCRESPVIDIVQHLTKHGNAVVVVYDPHAMDTACKILGDSVTYVPDKESAVRGTHVLVILTEWSEFAKTEMRKVRSLMDTPAKVIDCCSLHTL